MTVQNQTLDFNDTPPAPRARAATRMSVAQLADTMNDRIADLARELLGEPNRELSSAQQLRFGTKGSVAVEIFPPGFAPTTLVLDGKRRLVALHTRGVRGKRVIVYAKHKRVRGVMLPHSLVVSSAGRPQSIEYSKIELNPKVSADIFK